MLDRSGSLIDHLNIAVPDLASATEFYDRALAPLGIVRFLNIPAHGEQLAMSGFGWPDRKPFFWLLAPGTVGENMHLAFTAETREVVDAFHRAALAAGATELLPPGVHPEYHDDYYGAFVVDPHGINLEAVCHHPAGS